MNYLETIQQIRTTLSVNGYENISNDVLEQQLSGGTGGEVLIMVCSFLLGLKERNSNAYEKIEGLVLPLIRYANSLGLYPKPTYPSGNSFET